MANYCVIGVAQKAVADILALASSLVPADRGLELNQAALLLTCAELSLLLAGESWCVKEDKAETIASLRKKAYGHAWCVLHQFNIRDLS